MKTGFSRNQKKFIFIPFGAAALLALISYIVMLLWNNLLPEILHVNTITFWQALGIFILCKILFGFGKGGGGGGWSRRNMAERCRSMSPEERQHFKQTMKDKLCNWKKPEPDNNL
jgi:hypothetical protein